MFMTRRQKSKAPLSKDLVVAHHLLWLLVRQRQSWSFCNRKKNKFTCLTGSYVAKKNKKYNRIYCLSLIVTSPNVYVHT